MSPSSSRPFALALLGLVALGCGDEPAAPAGKPAPETQADTKADPGAEPVAAAPDVGTAKDFEDPAGEAPPAVDPEVAAIDPEEPLPEEVPHAEAAHPGPCKITWSTGAKLTFTYEGEGGTVKADTDGNGKVDACGTFTIAEGKTTKVTIDEGCNDSIESSIEPSYDTKSNVATASFTETNGDAQTKRDVTMIDIAGFTGLTPGYPIYASRKNAKVYVRGGLARKATVKSPWQGPDMVVTFGYSKENRVLRVKEDHGRDGTTDRRFDYRYDDQGNVIAMSVVLGNGDTVQKGRAKLDYSCHE